jgi:hypothetical protein
MLRVIASLDSLITSAPIDAPHVVAKAHGLSYRLELSGLTRRLSGRKAAEAWAGEIASVPDRIRTGVAAVKERAKNS